MIDKNGWIKEMVLEHYSNKYGDFDLEFSQTPFGDLATINKFYIDDNKYEHRSGYKSIYLPDSRNNDELFYINNDKAINWFYNIMGIKRLKNISKEDKNGEVK
jgi:hypothetical protein